MSVPGGPYDLVAAHEPQPDSPLDPFGHVTNPHDRYSRPLVLGRQDSNSSFFNAVYLDDRVGPTRPLRVRKRPAAVPRLAPIGPVRHRRRSAPSLPQSPRSPRTPTTPSTPTVRPRFPRKDSNASSRKSTSTVDAAAAAASTAAASLSISSIFLSLPAEDEPGLQPALPIHKHGAHNTRKARSSSNQSELHLGLGRFAVFDEAVVPGPSPPVTPGPSPVRRTFGAATRPTDQHMVERDRHRRRVGTAPGTGAGTLPRSPLTPSRAPRKAAELLGTGPTSSRSKPASGSNKVSKPVKRTHYRPLPNATLVEIQAFFGDKRHKGSKRSDIRISTKRMPVTSDPHKDRQLGQGGTVAHKDEHGNSWLDVEEEAEFAWLMSDARGAVSPNVPRGIGTETAEQGVWEDLDAEDSWEMKAFTSVLALPSQPRLFRETEVLLDSDSDVTPTAPLPRRTPKHDLTTAQPWSTTMATAHPWSTTVATPLVVPPPRTSSRPPPTRAHTRTPSPTSSLANSDTTSDRETSSASSSAAAGGRIKRRPIPLTLHPPKHNRRLPVVSSSPPMPPVQTPFVHPRSAPKPNPGPADADTHAHVQVHTQDQVQAQVQIPTPAQDTQAESRGRHAGSQPHARRAGADAADARDAEPVSFFEPLTPVEATSLLGGHARFLSGSKDAMRDVAKASGGRWFRKVVRPLVR